jgi:hypothetical protein
MGNTLSATTQSDKTAVEQVEELRQQHHELKRQLEGLNRHLSLTPEEQLQSARIKKEKLLLKDRIATLGGQV